MAEPLSALANAYRAQVVFPAANKRAPGETREWVNQIETSRARHTRNTASE